VLLLFEKKYRRCDPRARERINNLLEFATVCLILLFVRRYYYSPEKIQAPPFWLLPEEGTRESKFFFPRFQHTHTRGKGDDPHNESLATTKKKLCVFFFFRLFLRAIDLRREERTRSARYEERKTRLRERERERGRVKNSIFAFRVKNERS